MRQTELSREWKMMQKIAAVFCAAILLAVLCAACKAKELPDTYVEGSDYQYMQMEDGLRFTLTRAQGGKGMYFLHGDYIYFLDKETNTILPLCNKADCLHDQETDSEKYVYCNACMLPSNGFPTGELGISYCNGVLYCLDRGFGSRSPILYRISEDGSNREEIYEWENCQVNEWLIHRNVLYYTKRIYENTDGKVKESYQICALSLTDSAKKEKVVFTADADLEVVTLGKPTAYGNHLYFQIVAYIPAEEEITDDNFLEYLYYKTFEYNIVSGQISELLLPDMLSSEYVSGVVFWDDKLLFDSFDFAADDTASSDWYIAKLDGSNPEIFMTDIPKYSMFTSDGEYLYLTNAHTVSRGKEDEDDLLYEVYDQDLEKIDTFKPTTLLIFNGVLPLGTDAMYLQYDSGDENDPSWGVMRWDKQIGTYHGEPIDKDIVDIPR